MKIDIRTKSEYMNQPDWQQLYLLTRNWQSDIRFYLDKIRFFRHLVNQRLIWLQDEQIIKELKAIHNELVNTVQQCQKLNEELHAHVVHFQELNENPFSHNEEVFRSEHAKLEKDVTEFTKEFRSLKKEVIRLAEKAIDSEHNTSNLSYD